MGQAKFISSNKLLKLDNITHGFFTRSNGVSKGIYKGLNVGLGSNDDRQLIIENRRLSMQAINADICDLRVLHQIHSNKIITVDDKFDSQNPPKGDGMVTKQKAVVLGILTADCTPILFADPVAGVIGAAHAGWKGALAGIGVKTVIAMERLGAKRKNITAVIGPSIGKESYEVSGEFRDRFLNIDADNGRFFTIAKKSLHYMFDIGGYNQYQISILGLANIDHLKYDTCANEDMFFSYRRACNNGQIDYGRQFSAIKINII